MNQRGEAPISVIKRLPVYLRVLDNLVKRDIEVVSSKSLSKETGFTAEQIRKDLAFFGAFGTRGTGYNTNYLRERVLRIIGLDKQTNVAIVGAGHLGTAFARYNVRENPYTSVVGLFDVSPDIVGENIEGVPVYHLNDLQEIVRKERVQVGVITVPAVHAQEVVDRLVEENVKALLNFAPAKLTAPEDVRIHNVDLTIELQSLIYFAKDELNEESTQDLE
ncbi:redox-sensing transcriptional repressor Rex [Natranaerobius thermophilus]|uniref:Redox-sensing transcriptional repressor Rex n=1 Tax=Natranaerobius thermophilus (strain ATCC BAA-1301 / DSM 18059 / JW/NM-WN-LF) TaxID=457570 RepID=REX_NATTJ|nr:redox-sensing transcriptional repressor Rex [Natranaerobius thermophilus]B2A618.1 RecName: Full=Redox-sensing transcriptional repressor Rex [Natranaerobius thermophilus JW/NM-WN-LF]ACB85435.1 CoA-binding domain protein [Natranaerobius thermophilus JW/NM-WN-LF]